jgi:hypothetical protein
MRIKMNKEWEYIKKLSKRQKQKFKILANNPNFQTDIATIRKEWDIDENGFDSSEKILDWERKLQNANNDFYKTEWPKYRSEIDELQKKDFLESERRQKEINLLAPLNAFRKQTTNIIIKYNRPPRWKEGIRAYILSGRELIFMGPIIKKEFDEDTNQDLLFIQIDDDTTKEDIVTMWHLVKIHQKDLPYRKKEKYQPIPNYDLYKTAYDLKQKGKSANEIADIMGTSERAFCDSEINEFVRRYKEISDINPS